MDELMRLQSELEALLKAGRPLQDPQLTAVSQEIERMLDCELGRLYLRQCARTPDSTASGAAGDGDLEASSHVPPGPPKVIQLRCALCDHWHGNGGGCAGRGNCEDFQV